ncbi:MAG: helix-turn-helix transcriptional regulator [Neisseria sp.]|nr:helix-turn-helix transcriptional regulator [Neisseria sp.]
MVKNGNHTEITQISREELDICLFSEFWQSGHPEDELARAQLDSQHRFNQYIWLWITEGECAHLLDFEQIVQKTGEWLLIRPNQVHHFLSMQGWDGWGLSFPAEWLPAELMQEWQNLPYRQKVDAPQAQWLLPALAQLKRCRYADWQNRNARPLIQAQLRAFLTLLITLYAQNTPPEDRQNLRWQQFNRLLEQHFSTQHQVGFYAERLACSEKTLGTLCLAQSGQPAKAVITDRLLLEAKRLLIHTPQSVKQIALQLGFEEATHFNKFFKKQQNTTPKAFRKNYLAAYGDN